MLFLFKSKSYSDVHMFVVQTFSNLFNLGRYKSLTRSTWIAYLLDLKKTTRPQEIDIILCCTLYTVVL